MVADTLVRAAGKGKVAVGRAADVKAFGVGELRRVTVGPTYAHMDARARPHGYSVHTGHAACDGVARGHAVPKLVRAFEAQHLLHRSLDQRRFGDQPRLLFRPLRQRHKAVADEVGGGFVPGVEDKNAVL